MVGAGVFALVLTSPVTREYSSHTHTYTRSHTQTVWELNAENRVAASFQLVSKVLLHGWPGSPGVAMEARWPYFLRCSSTVKRSIRIYFSTVYAAVCLSDVGRCSIKVVVQRPNVAANVQTRRTHTHPAAGEPRASICVCTRLAKRPGQ